MSETIDLLEYVALKTESSFCPTCESTVILLTPLHGTRNDPSYYICTCGYLGKVGNRLLRHGAPSKEVSDE